MPFDTERLTHMSWSFGMFVVLICLLILLACLAVKLLFKRRLRLKVVRERRAGGSRTLIVRTPVTTIVEAQRSADATGLPRALMGTSGPSPVILVILGLVGWLFWRVLVSWQHVLDRWAVWTFDVIFLLVAAQLVLACFEGRVAGDEDFRVAVLVPLYNEDPDVVVRMLSALLHQSFPPAEIHVVDDGSTQSTYLEQRDWFIRQAAVAGIYATWQRTSNEGKRHAQVHGFRKIRDADLFVTVDSDSMLDAEALHEIVQPFSDPRVMSVAGVILAINNRENLLARVTDVIFVGQQLIDRSSMSQLGSVMVDSGGLAAYRCRILAENIDLYMNESYLGRHVEFSDDSMLTLFALLNGRTVQQPSAFAFAWMPDRWSHHYRQQVRWFRGSFIRGLWRIRFLPILSWGWWRQATGWMQIWTVSAVFVYLVLWRPLATGGSVPLAVVFVPLAIGLAQNSRYLNVWRSDTTDSQRRATLLLSPVATLWSAVILRPLRFWGVVTSGKMGWNTRQQVEVTSQ